MTTDWEKQLFGKTINTSTRAVKARATAQRTAQKKQVAYDNAFDQYARNYARDNNMQYNDSLKNALKTYHQQQQDTKPIFDTLAKSTQRRQLSEHRQENNFISNPKNADKVNEYHQMNQKLGWQDDSPVTKANYNSLKSTFDRLNTLKQQKDVQMQNNQFEHPQTTGQKFKTLFKGIGKQLVNTEQLLNPFDSVSAKQAKENFKKVDKVLGGKEMSSFINKGNEEVNRQLDRYTDAVTLRLSGALLKKKLGNKAVEYRNENNRGSLGQIMDGVTDGIGMLAPGTLALIGAKVTGDISKLKKLGQVAKEGATAGALYEGLNTPGTMMRDNESLKDASKRIALGTVAGAGLNVGGQVAFNKLGKALSKLKKPKGDAASIGNTLNPKEEVQKQPLLGLPAPKSQTLPKTSVNDVTKAMKELGFKTQPKSKPLTQKQYSEGLKHIENGKWDMMKQGYENQRAPHTTNDLEAMAQQITKQRAPKMIDGKPQSYYVQRYNDLIKHVKKNYPNGLQNDEHIQEAWSHIAKKDEDFNVNQLVERAFNGDNKNVGISTTQYKEPILPQLKHQFEADQKIKQAVNDINSWKAPPKPLALGDSPLNVANRSADEVQKQINVNKLNELVTKIGKKGKNINDYSKAELEQAFATGKLPKSSKTVKPSTQIAPAEAINIDSAPNAAMKKLANVSSQPSVKAADKVTKDYTDLKNVKDITSFQTGTKNIYELADRLPGTYREHLVTNLDNAKNNHVSYQETHTDHLFNDIVKGLSIKKGSKESALVQDYGDALTGPWMHVSIFLRVRCNRERDSSTTERASDEGGSIHAVHNPRNVAGDSWRSRRRPHHQPGGLRRRPEMGDAGFRRPEHEGREGFLRGRLDQRHPPGRIARLGCGREPCARRDRQELPNLHRLFDAGLRGRHQRQRLHQIHGRAECRTCHQDVFRRHPQRRTARRALQGSQNRNLLRARQARPQGHQEQA